MMMMMMMTSTLRGSTVRGTTHCDCGFSHPGSDVATLYIFDNQLHYGRWRVSLCVVSWVNLHPLPPTQPSISAQAAQHHCPLSVATSVILRQFLRPLESSCHWTDFAVSGLHPCSPIRAWGDVKESIWMNKWCPSAKKRRLAEEGSLKMHPSKRLCPT